MLRWREFLWTLLYFCLSLVTPLTQLNQNPCTVWKEKLGMQSEREASSRSTLSLSLLLSPGVFPQDAIEGYNYLTRKNFLSLGLGPLGGSPVCERSHILWYQPPMQLLSQLRFQGAVRALPRRKGKVREVSLGAMPCGRWSGSKTQGSCFPAPDTRSTGETANSKLVQWSNSVFSD